MNPFEYDANDIFNEVSQEKLSRLGVLELQHKCHSIHCNHLALTCSSHYSMQLSP